MYAKIVLDNLLQQNSQGDFENEMSQETFPNGLEDAYVTQASPCYLITNYRHLATNESHIEFSITVQNQKRNLQKVFSLGCCVLRDPCAGGRFKQHSVSTLKREYAIPSSYAETLVKSHAVLL